MFVEEELFSRLMGLIINYSAVTSAFNAFPLGEHPSRSWSLRRDPSQCFFFSNILDEKSTQKTRKVGNTNGPTPIRDGYRIQQLRTSRRKRARHTRRCGQWLNSAKQEACRDRLARKEGSFPAATPGKRRKAAFLPCAHRKALGTEGKRGKG